MLSSGRRMVRAGHNAKEILIPKISVTGLGNYTRNVGYKTGAITYEFETKTFNYDRGIRLFAEYGAGEVGCFQIGEFSVKNYASQQTTGEELATAAALRELGLSGMAFSGVC